MTRYSGLPPLPERIARLEELAVDLWWSWHRDARQIFRVLDYSEYGGAPLLGVKGVCIICHGSSSPKSIKVAIRGAVHAAEVGLSSHIGAQMAALAGRAA